MLLSDSINTSLLIKATISESKSTIRKSNLQQRVIVGILVSLQFGLTLLSHSKQIEASAFLLLWLPGLLFGGFFDVFQEVTHALGVLTQDLHLLPRANTLHVPARSLAEISELLFKIFDLIKDVRSEGVVHSGINRLLAGGRRACCRTWNRG